MEVAPADLEKILRARSYEETSVSESLDEQINPSDQKRIATRQFLCGDGTSNCLLFTDDSHTWVSFEYSTD